MQKYTAIILASRDTNEFDRIYFLYTREMGLARAVGRGVRKPNAKLAGHLEPGTLSEVYVARSRGMGQITSAITLENFEKAKNNLRKIAEFLEISRFFLKNFAEGERDERIFELLNDFLEILEGENQKEIAREAFWWKLFDFFGNRPDVLKCVGCQKKLSENSKKFFSVEKGGMICPVCAPNFKNMMPISDNQIKLLRIFLGNSLPKIGKVRVEKKELENLAKIRQAFRRFNFQDASFAVSGKMM